MSLPLPKLHKAAVNMKTKEKVEGKLRCQPYNWNSDFPKRGCVDTMAFG